MCYNIIRNQTGFNTIDRKENNMASITKVEIWEDIAGNVIGLVFDPTGQLTNAVQNLAAQQPLPRPALVERELRAAGPGTRLVLVTP